MHGLSRACPIKHYGFVIYGKCSDFVVSYKFWLGQIHSSLNKQTYNLTTESVDYGSLIFYNTGPWSYLGRISSQNAFT